MFRCIIPEIVEVALSAELIKPLVIGKKINNASVGNKSRYKNKLPECLLEFNINKPSVIDIKTKGKFMYWIFDENFYLMNTFGMSGQWSSVEGKHPCLIFQFTDESKIYFNDPRHFGTIKFTNNKQDLLEKLNKLGWDPLQDSYSDHSKWLKSIIMNSNKPICQLLMDQSIFAGVGNYIKAECLYLSKMSPWRSGKSLSEQDIDVLCKSIIMVVEESYKYQGATIQTYKTVYGEDGKYSSCFKVYGRKTDPLGNPIIKEDTPEGRTTHWCPTIQR